MTVGTGLANRGRCSNQRMPALGVFVVFAGCVNTIGWAAVVSAEDEEPDRDLIGGATATSRFYLGHGLASDGRQFGSFGVVIALLAWGLILVLISMLCAVFAPVWAEWRESERAAEAN